MLLQSESAFREAFAVVLLLHLAEDWKVLRKP
jgi:hypothetical protein